MSQIFSPSECPSGQPLKVPWRQPCSIHVSQEPSGSSHPPSLIPSGHMSSNSTTVRPPLKLESWRLSLVISCHFPPPSDEAWAMYSWGLGTWCAHAGGKRGRRTTILWDEHWGLLGLDLVASKRALRESWGGGCWLFLLALSNYQKVCHLCQSQGKDPKVTTVCSFHSTTLRSSI